MISSSSVIPACMATSTSLAFVQRAEEPRYVFRNLPPIISANTITSSFSSCKNKRKRYPKDIDNESDDDDDESNDESKF